MCLSILHSGPVRLALAALVFAAGSPMAAGQRVPAWRAGEQIEEADLIVAADLILGTPVYPSVDADGLFGELRGTTLLHRLKVTEKLAGDVQPGTEIVLVQPPGGLHFHANIRTGESLLFLKRVDEESAQKLRERMPPWSPELPGTVWTFVADDHHQWMSWSQLDLEVEGERVPSASGLLVSQLLSLPGVTRQRDSILGYIRGLIALREQVRQSMEQDRARRIIGDLDRFQQDVVRAARAAAEEPREQ